MGAGLGLAIGGALQGIGQGIVAQGQMAFEERRKLAHEALRHSNELAEQERQADLTDRNAARQVERTTSSQIVVDKAKTGNNIVEKGVEHDYAVKLKGVEFNNAVRLEGVKAGNDRDLARLRAGLERANDAASKQLAAQIDAGQVHNTVVAADGSIWAYSKTGAVLGHSKPGKFVPPSAGRGLGAGLLGDLGVEGDATAGEAEPATAAAPAAAPAPARAPNTGRGIQQPRSGNRGAPAPGQKTYTVADAQATAAQHKVPIEEVHRRMRAAGYKLTSN